jgi:hypothetical protein
VPLLEAAGVALAESYTREEGFDRPGSDYETFEQDHASPDPDNCEGLPAKDGLGWSTQAGDAEYLAVETDGRRLDRRRP